MRIYDNRISDWMKSIRKNTKYRGINVDHCKTIYKEDEKNEERKKDGKIRLELHGDIKKLLREGKNYDEIYSILIQMEEYKPFEVYLKSWIEHDAKITYKKTNKYVKDDEDFER